MIPGNTANRDLGWAARMVGNHPAPSSEYQELKFTLHRKLLDRINLETLSSMPRERVRAEIRSAVRDWSRRKGRRSAWWRRTG